MPYKNKDNYNKFMQEYMREWRRKQAEMIAEMRKQLNIPKPHPGRRKKN